MLTITVASGSSFAFVGALGGGFPNFSIVKAGAGTQALSGSSSYTGATTLAAGVLAVGSGNALGSGGAISFGGGTVSLGGGTISVTGLLSGTGTIDGNAAVTGLHSPGNSPGIQTVTGSLSYGPGASVLWEITDNATTNSPVVFDQIVVGGNLAFDAATSLTLSFDSAGRLIDWEDPFWDVNQS